MYCHLCSWSLSHSSPWFRIWNGRDAGYMRSCPSRTFGGPQSVFWISLAGPRGWRASAVSLPYAFSFLPGLSRSRLSVLPWLQVWFCPREGCSVCPPLLPSSPHLRPTFPYPFLRVCPRPPQQLSLTACTSLSSPVALSWLQLASGNMFPKGRDCVHLRPVLSPHT